MFDHSTAAAVAEAESETAPKVAGQQTHIYYHSISHCTFAEKGETTSTGITKGVYYLGCFKVRFGSKHRIWDCQVKMRLRWMQVQHRRFKVNWGGLYSLDNRGGGGLGLPWIRARKSNISLIYLLSKYKSLPTLRFHCNSINKIPLSTFSTKTPTYVVLYRILCSWTLS